MNKKSNKIISVLFLLITFIFGIGTIKNCSVNTEGLNRRNDLKTNINIIESSIQENFIAKNHWININGFFHKLTGKTIVNGVDGTDVNKLNNGQIIYNMPYINDNSISNISNNIKEFNDYLKMRNIDFVYTQLPSKVDEYEDVIPVGANIHANDNANRLISKLNNNNISVLDIRKNFHEEGLDYKNLFYNTDQHWKPDAALHAAGLIGAYLKNNYGFKISLEKYYNLKNYNVKTYKDWFLGSIGKRVGTLYAGVDDFDIITPKFHTSYSFYADTLGGKDYRKGNFENVMIKKERIENKDYFNINTYTSYIGGDYKLNIIDNNNADNNKKILLLRDSFSCTMAPYLSLSCKQLTTIDIRYYKGNLIDYIDKNKPDIVLLAYNANFYEKEFEFGF